MRIKTIIIVFFLCFAYCSGISQVIVNDSIKNNEKSNYSDENSLKNDINQSSVYFELLGNGLYYSLGFKRTIVRSNNSSLSFATGFSYIPSQFFISPQALFSIGGKFHRLELGLGFTTQVITGYQRSSYNYLVFYRIGYRYQRKNSNVFFKIAFTPFTFTTLSDSFSSPLTISWIGITVGRTL